MDVMKVKARTRRETRGNSDDTSWIDKGLGLFVRINHLPMLMYPTPIHLYTMPDLSQAVPAKDLKQWHSPSSRNEAIDTLIHGVGKLPDTWRE